MSGVLVIDGLVTPSRRTFGGSTCGPRRAALVTACLLMLLVGCASRPQAKYPIDLAPGEYTVVALEFVDDVERDGTVSKYAVELANEWVEVLRAQGHQAYVADLGNAAKVALGSYPSRQSAERGVENAAKILQSVGSTRVTVRGARRSTGRRILGTQPHPEEVNYLQRQSRKLRP